MAIIFKDKRVAGIGTSGASAYDIVKRHGYEGTEEEFAESLRTKIQSDWSVNDQKSPAFIKDRPFYETRQSTEIWDGNLDTALDSIILEIPDYGMKAGWVKISDEPISFTSENYKFLERGNLGGAFGETERTAYVWQTTDDYVSYHDGHGSAQMYSIIADSYQMEEVGALTRGVWGAYIKELNTGNEIYYAGLLGDSEIKKIDFKYLPDGIGTQSDWNQNDETAPDYVKNRPFYVDGGLVEVIILPETQVGSINLDTQVNLIVGETYAVTYNGIEYECIAYELMNAPVIGNASIYDSELAGGNNEPFLIVSIHNLAFFPTEGSHRISIKTFRENVHKIPRKFLPEGYPYSEVIENQELFNNNSIEIGDELYISLLALQDLNVYGAMGRPAQNLFPLVAGRTYKVIFNNTVYYCTARIWRQAILLGNGAIYGDELNEHNEPFSIDYYPLENCYLNVSNPGTYSLQIFGDIDTFFPLDSKYISDDIARVEYVDEQINNIPQPDLSSYSKATNLKNGDGTGSLALKNAWESNAYGKQSIALGSGILSYGENSFTVSSGSVSVCNITGDANAVTYTVGVGGGGELPSGLIVRLKNKNNYAKIVNYDSSSRILTLDTSLSTSALNNAELYLFRGAHGKNSVAFGDRTWAQAENSFASGLETRAIGKTSHAEGKETVASGECAHVEGYQTTASGTYSHAEGFHNTASGYGAHTEGSYTTASAQYSHAEGWSATASGTGSHAEGYHTTAFGRYSHAEGEYTTANSKAQHVQGEYNILDVENQGSRGTYAHIVGNGFDEERRSNAHTLDWNGNAWFARDVYVGSTGGKNKDDGSKKLATEEYAGNVAEVAAAAVKDDLLNGAGEAYDTLKELSELINENQNAIQALETVATSKASKEELTNHNSATDAHSDIRQAIANIQTGTTVVSQSTNSTNAVNATNAANIYSAPSTGKAYVLGTATTGTGNKATVYNASVYTQDSVLFGAAWNDYAEFRIADCREPGRVICENGDDTLSLATERLQPGANVISDTYGFAIGETEQAQTPIAVSGRVLVYTLEDRNEFKPGDAVCAAPNGTVSLMTREEIREYPERIVGTVSAVPAYETWGEKNVAVNGRIWIKVK